MKKKPWEEYPHIWKTESSFMSWIRGGIRRGLWNKSPVKLEFLKEHRRQIPNPNPKGRKPTVWGGDCALCGETFIESKLQVDHKQGNHKLTSIEDIQDFIEGIVLVGRDGLQMACKDCHDIKSYSDKYGISFEEARAEKMAIQIGKDKQDRQWLIDKGIEPMSNIKLRREQIVKRLLEDGD